MAFERLEQLVEGKHSAEREARLGEGRDAAVELLRTIADKLGADDRTWGDDYAKAQQIIEGLPTEDKEADENIAQVKAEYLEARRRWLESLGYETGDVPEEYLDQMIGISPINIGAPADEPEPTRGRKEPEIQANPHDVTDVQLLAIRVQLKLFSPDDKETDLDNVTRPQIVGEIVTDSYIKEQGSIQKIVQKAAVNWARLRDSLWPEIFPSEVRGEAFPLSEEVLERYSDRPKLQETLVEIGELKYYQGKTIGEVFLSRKRPAKSNE